MIRVHHPSGRDLNASLKIASEVVDQRAENSATPRDEEAAVAHVDAFQLHGSVFLEFAIAGGRRLLKSFVLSSFGGCRQ